MMRAVIADDDRVATTLLSRAMARWRFDVTLAGDGEAAWTAIQTQATDFAIVDWMMPELDGPALCRRIRANASTAHMYVVLLTSRNSPSDLIEGLDSGADDYLVKPFNLEELRARVHVGVRVVTLQTRLAERVAELEAAVSNVKQLQAMIPICSYCKRIRTDANDWEQLEAYISEHTDSRFSHGICPPCLATAFSALPSR